MGELKPCPFCGGENIELEYEEEIIWYRCRDCEATGPTTTKYSGEEDEEYINWNTRKEPSPYSICEICQDTGYYYDYLKFRSVKCECQKL